MKNHNLKFGKTRFNLTIPGNFNGVAIYELLNNTPQVIADGENLKSACLNWLESTCDISKIVVNMEFRVACSDIDSVDICGKAFDDYVESLSGEELFAELANGSLNFYVDWGKINLWDNITK